MTAVLAHTHYLPITWRGLAHTARVRDQFGQLFQFRCTHLLNELLSPLITPIVLMFYFRPRALDLVDFFRNFTVAVVGVGDVCSFAQMDVRKHGNPDWQSPAYSQTEAEQQQQQQPAQPPACETTQYTQGEHGKTELSLMHFTLTNPGWRMPNDARQFVHGIRRHAQHDLDAAAGPAPGGQPATAMEQSLYLVNSMDGEYSSIIQSAIGQTRGAFGAGGMQSSSQCSYGLRNPFAGAALATPDQHQQLQQHRQQQQQLQHQMGAPQRPTASYDFQHMLNQNMSMEADMMSGGGGDGGVQHHSQLLLDSIQEHSEANSGASARIAANQQRSQPSASSALLTSSVLRAPPSAHRMGASIVGGLSRREGPPDGSQEGLLLNSVFRPAGAELAGHPTEVTATDMCLSTLYLHELHHRQIQRRGGPTDQRYRPRHPSQWQSQFQAPAHETNVDSPSSQSQSFVSPSTSAGAGQLAMGSMGSATTLSAVENTPLLSGAKKS